MNNFILFSLLRGQFFVQSRYSLTFSILLVFLRCVGGEVGATSSLAPKLGPLGLVRRFSVCFWLCFLGVLAHTRTRIEYETFEVHIK